ncbi:MAG: hypothetical protein P8Y66_07575 [Nitrospirota bacterium]|jgi:hypothetical protein
MKKVGLIVFFALVTYACSVSSIYHDEDKAIIVANSFLKALINEDYDKAYSTFLSDRLKENVKLERFKSDLKDSQKIRGHLKKAVFDSYQPVPGQRAIQLYYNVTHDKIGAVPYHLVLEGDGKAGYTIIVLDIGNQMQYPPNIKFIGVKKIKKDRDIEVGSE